MGKSLIQQKRGKGGPRWTAPSFRYKGRANFLKLNESATITDLVHCQGHSAPLMELEYGDGETKLLQAPEGIKVGDKIDAAENAEVKIGNILPLKNDGYGHKHEYC